MRPLRASDSRGSLLLAGAALAALCCGCAYTLSGSLPQHIRTVAIPVFANNTVEFTIADDVTRAVVEAFQNDRRLTLAREKEADSVLRGTVMTYRNQVFGYTEQERATQYEIVLVVQAFYRDLTRNRDLWKEDALTVRTTYNVVAVGGVAPSTETEARAEVIQKLADQIVSRTVQGW